MHDQAIEAARILPEPAPHSRRETISAKIGVTESMHRAGNALQKRFIGIVQANHLDSGADF